METIKKNLIKILELKKLGVCLCLCVLEKKKGDRKKANVLLLKIRWRYTVIHCTFQTSVDLKIFLKMQEILKISTYVFVGQEEKSCKQWDNLIKCVLEKHPSYEMEPNWYMNDIVDETQRDQLLVTAARVWGPGPRQ